MKLDQNTQNWILDRAENQEALMWSEFIKFSYDELGMSSKVLAKYKSKTYKEYVKKVYKREFISVKNFYKSRSLNL